MNYSSINIQGNILGSEILEKIRTEDIRYQAAKDFGFDPQTPVRDEITLAWSLAVSHWNAFKQKREKLSPSDSGTTETRNHWMKPVLAILGYDLSSATAETINGRSYAISLRATNIDNFPVHIVGINQSLDARAESGGPRLSPHALAQEYLNNQEHMYALVSNGKFLRLLRDATRLSRLSYIEFNLEQMMEESLYAEFALLFRLLHCSRMPQKKDVGGESILEFYHQEALASGSRIRERLSKAVEQSIKELANGFLKYATNEHLRTAIAGQQISARDYYLYNLRIIYRVLFLMVIEERKLIFPSERDEKLEQQRDIYYRYYSVQRLAKLVEKSVYVDPRKTDLWQSLVTCFALFENGKYGKQLRIAPLGSGLFAPDALGILTEQALDNDSVLRVLRHLITFENENGQRVRVNYADLDVEEFGSVYEGLLEYEPQFLEPATHPVFIFKEGNERSKSGSHYTPEELVKPLIQHSLDYLIQDRLKDKDPKTALLSLKVCDVACGSGHILLSAARRIGFELAKLRSKEDQPSPTVLRYAIRDVINHCIYGVDKNPLAVELCKVAMWLEAHNPGEPLNFLDHHIKCGDAIVGLAHREELEKGIADEAFRALPADDKQIASAFLKRNKQERNQKEQAALGFEAAVNAEVEAVLEKYNLFKNLPERTPEEIADKEKQYRNYEHDYHRIRLRQLADAQVAQFFIFKTDANKSVLITDSEYRTFLRQVNKHLGVIQSNKLVKAEQVSIERRFFHWFLEFPEVFKGGGFDCILGNPPFLGGQKLSGTFGDNYLAYVKYQFAPIGAVDLVTYFFRRIFTIICQSGFQSLISTNTIAQGKAREDGLEIILRTGGIISHAIRSIKWPGLAAVEVSIVTIYKGLFSNKRILNYKSEENITSFLDNNNGNTKLYTIKPNLGRMFKGSTLLGEGFMVSKSEYDYIISCDEKNKQVVLPYLNGSYLNEDFKVDPQIFCITFFDFSLEKAKEFKVPFALIEEKVKPEREKLENSNPAKRKWWLHERNRMDLYQKIQGQFFYTFCKTTKYLGIVKLNGLYVLSQALFSLPDLKLYEFSILQSRIHEEFARKHSPTLKTDLQYTNTSCFETFPFPVGLSESQKQALEIIGDLYYEHRCRLMLTIYLGLTKTYNAFNAPEIAKGITTSNLQSFDKKSIEKNFGKEVWNFWSHLQKTEGTCSIEEAITGIVKLRDLHVQMDNAVLQAYGWSDIQLRHDFYEVDYLPENDRIRFTIHPDARKEVLKRLLELNHKIHEEEIAVEQAEKTVQQKSLKLKTQKEERQLILSYMRPETAYEPIYSVQDIARITRLNPQRVRRWLSMMNQEGYEGVSTKNSDGQPLFVNFYGVHELIVIYDLMEINKIPLSDIFDARKWLKERFGSGVSNFYPFTSKKVLDTISKAGKEIIFRDETQGDYITLGKGNSQLNLEFIKDFLKRIVFDKDMVGRLYLTDSHLFVIDPHLAGGRPCTVDKEILLDTIKSAYDDSKDVRYVAKTYEISEEIVNEALKIDRASMLN